MTIRVPPPPGPSSRSANMRANRRRDTAPEIALRRLLHARGYRFRVDLPLRPDEGRLIRPDITFTRAKVTVFVDGCYWHGCPEHGRREGGANASYWGPKIARNQERDAEQRARLERAGWTVVRIWEHDDTTAAAHRIGDIVDRVAPPRPAPPAGRAPVAPVDEAKDAERHGEAAGGAKDRAIATDR